MLTQREIDLARKCDLKDRAWAHQYAANLGISIEVFAEYTADSHAYYLQSQGYLMDFADWKRWKALKQGGLAA